MSSRTRPRIPEKLYGVIGKPVAHSLSPLIHNRAFELAGLPAAYMAFEVEPGNLPAFVAAARVLPISGLSVTIPHKRAVAELLDGLSSTALAVGAVNTLFWRDGRLLGENTDVAGFLAPLKELPAMPASVLVLGVGGAARAVFRGLAEHGLQKVSAAARDADKAQKPCAEFGIRYVPWDERLRAAGEAELIVNATPLGMSGKFEKFSPLDQACFSPNQIVYDLVYNPLRTKLLEQAGNQGCRIIEGIDMFIGQATEQFRLWTGLDFPKVEIAKLLAEELG